MRPLAVLLLVLTWTAPALAESEVDRLFLEGRELLNKNEPAKACEKFHAANRLDTSALSVLLNLGICYERQGKLASALDWYRLARQKSSEVPNPTEESRQYERAANEKATELVGKVAKLSINAVQTQAEAQISVDGKPVERTQLTEAIELDPGKHEVRATAPGMEPFVKELEIKNEQRQEVVVPLLSVAASEKPATTAGKSRRPLGIGMAVGGVVLAGGLAFVAKSYRDGIEKDNPEQESFTGGQHVVMGALGVGVVAGAGAAILGTYLIIKGGPRQEQRVAVRPVVAPGNVGFVLGGRF